MINHHFIIHPTLFNALNEPANLIYRIDGNRILMEQKETWCMTSMYSAVEGKDRIGRAANEQII